MEQTVFVLSSTFAATVVLMLTVWLASLRLRDASIVDIVWGPGFVLIASVAFWLGDGWGPRRAVVLALAAVWGLRLGWHLFRRNWGKGEDYRYQAMRARHGDRFGLVSLYTVYGLQGLLMWFISIPLQLVQTAAGPAHWTAWDAAGAVLWTVGFLFESIGDIQLARFKSDPRNAGKVLQSGLWAFTRHPNYFGDAVLWWGFFIFAMATPQGPWTILSPVAMTFLLMRVSGVPLLEKRLSKTRPEYAEYVRRTNAFFPWFPRRQGHEELP